MCEVSVVIPSYNASPTIQRAVESVMRQTFDDLEIIVVDDGSDDDTVDIIQENYEDQVLLITHDINRGAAAARNTGINAASGDYIAFLDADDIYKPTKIQDQYELLQRKSDKYIGVHCREDKKSNRIHRKIEKIVSGLIKTISGENYDENANKLEHQYDLLTANSKFGNTSTLFIKKAAIEDINGFDERFHRHQDWEFLIRLLEIGRIAYIDDRLVIRGDTGRPSAYDYEIAKAKYIRKFKGLVEEFESQGKPVVRYNNLELSKYFFRDDNPSRGIYYLNRSSFRNGSEILAILWSVFIYIVCRLVKPAGDFLSD